MYMNMRRSDYNLLKSFYFAFSGICYALCRERNLRVHFVAAAFMLYITKYYDMQRGEYAILLLTIGFVVSSELVNTAVEKTVDIESPVWNALAKIAKDVAAGAVLVAGITSIAIASILFWDTAIFKIIFADILDNLFVWILLILVALYWIFLPGCKKKNNFPLDT